jgi:thiosulfate/3-mercaptopyruvate sulfurtransferase
MASYAHPEMLVETEWLADHMDDPGIRLVDADFPQQYARAHIPGAVGQAGVGPFLKTDERRGGEHGAFLLGPEDFAERMSRMGVGDGSLVVAYDNRMGSYAARLWWALRTYGFQNVKVLNGGWHKWLAEGRPVTSRVPRVEPVVFTPRRDDSMYGTCDLLKAAVGRPDVAILDVRSDDEYAGRDDRGNLRRGHVPGAVHLEWTQLVTDDDRRVFRPADEMLSLLESRGITRDKQVHLY